jgi:hypothetical protein
VVQNSLAATMSWIHRDFRWPGRASGMVIRRRFMGN